MSLNPFNPFTEELNPLKSQLADVKDQMFPLENQILWYKSFDLDSAHSKIMQAKVDLQSTQSLRTAATNRLTQTQSIYSTAEADAAPGFNPTYWFSSKRAIAKRVLVEAKAELDTAQAECDRLDQVVVKNEKIIAGQDAIDRYRKFDLLEAEAVVQNLGIHADHLFEAISPLQTKSDELDSKVEVLVSRLLEAQAEVVDIRRLIQKAQSIEEKFQNATKHEKFHLHRESEAELGHDKPSQVIREKRGALTSRLAEIEKLETRIKESVRHYQRDVQALVIDGNNMCYRSSMGNSRDFIGLIALRPLVAELATRFKVSVVFDPGIAKRLKLTPSDLRRQFPNATVHLMPSKIKADESVLAESEFDSKTFVVSNDRFKDFPDKAAVIENRIFKHLIQQNSVQLLELGINAKLEELDQDAS